MEDNVNWNWKEIFDKSEDSLNLFVKEHKNLLPLKIDEFHLRINQNSDVHQDVWILENIVRKVLPVFIRISSDDKTKLVEIFRRVLQSTGDLLESTFNGVDRDISLLDGSNRVEVHQESLRFGIVLIDLTRDCFELGKGLHSDSVLMVLIHQMPTILSATFSHCQNSPRIYSNLLDLLSSDLRNLFLKAKVSLTALIDAVDVGHENYSWVMLDKFVTSLEKLQKNLLDLDFHAFGVVCKCYMRLCESHWTELWEVRLDPMPHFRFVARKTEDSAANISKFIQNCDEQGLKRESSIMVFYLKTIRHQSQIFQDSLSDKTDYYNVLTSLGSTLSSMDDLTTNFTSNFDFFNLSKLSSVIPGLIHAFIVQLLEDPNYIDYAFKLEKTDLKIFSPGIVILWTKILSEIWNPNNIGLIRVWFQEDNNLFNLLVKTIDVSHPILCESPHLTGIQFSGKPLTSYTSYEFILTRTQAFIAGLQPELLSYIENTILETILSPDASFWAKQLCLDAWVFLLRYGPSELCLSHVTLIVNVFLSIPDVAPCPVFLRVAIQRLTMLLTAEDLKKLEDTYPPCSSSRHLRLWGLVSDSQRGDSNTSSSLVISTVTSTFRQIISGGFTLHTFDKVVSSMKIINRSWGCIDSRQKKIFEETLFKVWSVLEKNQESIAWENNFVFEFMMELFNLTANAEDLKIIEVVCSMCGKVGEPYLIESCAWILVKKFEKRSEQDKMSLSKKLTGLNENGLKNLLFIDVLTRKRSNSSSDIEYENFRKDDYFSNIQFHGCHPNCAERSTDKLDNHMRISKKRKIIEEETHGPSERALSALSVLRNEMKSWRISESEINECTEALEVLERFSRKNA